MITQELVVSKILAYLNGELTETELVYWAEDALVTLFESDADIPAGISNEDAVIDALSYIGAGDTPGFPLTWAVLSEILTRFGTHVRVIADVA